MRRTRAFIISQRPIIRNVLPNTTQHCAVLLHVLRNGLATKNAKSAKNLLVNEVSASGDFTGRHRYGDGMKPLGVLMLLGGGALSVFSSESSNSVTVPIELRRGHVMVPAKAGGTNFSFLLDTGYGMT